MFCFGVFRFLAAWFCFRATSDVDVAFRSSFVEMKTSASELGKKMSTAPAPRRVRCDEQVYNIYIYICVYSPNLTTSFWGGRSGKRKNEKTTTADYVRELLLLLALRSSYMPASILYPSSFFLIPSYIPVFIHT